MDLLTTPARANRLLIPGLDMKSPQTDMATAITYAGLHTPPQSAHESRRPSLQSPWSDAPYSAGMSSFPNSLPTTPVHRIQKHQDSFIHGWSDADIASSSASSRQLDQHIVNSGIRNQSYLSPAIHGLPPYSNAAQNMVTDAFSLQFDSGVPAREVWARSGPSPCPFTAQTTCLESDLFPMTQSLTPHDAFSESILPHSESALGGMDVNFDVTAIRPMNEPGVSQGSLYHHPQMVIPSQISPQDTYDHSRFDEYPGFEHGPGSLTESFRSCSRAFDAFEVMDPPSPMEAYFDNSDDEHYQFVKREDASLHTRTQRSNTAHKYSSASKRRSSKRLRSEKQPWHRHETGGIEVQCEGTKFCLDRPTKYVAGNRKVHVCTFTKKDGQPCGAGFERSEHLKRHQGSHTKNRPYWCPLDRCDKKIQRPDNACDHFKTHLRPPKKGKRNYFVEWEVLRDAIWEKFADKKKAADILKNLTKWIENDMQDAPGRGRRA